jgi:predicted membrane protein
MSPWDQNFPISKMKTIQNMSFVYKIICLGVVFGIEDKTEQYFNTKIFSPITSVW